MKTSLLNKNVGTCVLATLTLSLAGCAAMNTAITHRNLNVQTKMSQTIFLQPVSSKKKTVYVDVHNTSNHQISYLKSELISAVKQKGYRVFSNPDHAHYLLQANVLQIGKISKTAADNYLTGGYGGAISGMAIGGASGALLGETNASTLGGALVGGVVGTVADDLVTDTTFSMITDVQISERLGKNQHAISTTTADMNQGTSTHQVTRLSGRAHWMRYRTRIVSTADKVNLKFATAKPVLKKQLVISIANIF